MFPKSSFDYAAVAMHRGAFVLLLFFVASSSLSRELKEFSNGKVADADDVNFNFTLLKDAIDALALEPTSTIIAAEGPPSGDIGDVGDVYIDTASYDFYGPKDTNGWGLGRSFKSFLLQSVVRIRATMSLHLRMSSSTSRSLALPWGHL